MKGKFRENLEKLILRRELIMLIISVLLISCKDDDDIETGSLSIMGIPAEGTLQMGNMLTVNDVSLTAIKGIQSFSVSIDGEEPHSLNALISDIDNNPSEVRINVEYDTEGLSVGIRTLDFVLTDVEGGETSVQHTLTLTAYGIVTISSNLTSSATWTNDNLYVLSSRVIVEPGAVLSIEAGTLIKGEFGDGANATALIIARGAQIMAEGTADAPIIFTSIADELTPTDVAAGIFASPNLNESNSGLWGGLIVLGKAPISEETNIGVAQIEGIPGDVSLAQYGGTAPDDNSGTLNYVSVRHGGTRLGDGDEINGITFGGVGSGTTINHIEVVANLDDGIELFGGTVNISNVLIWAADDDAIDIDQAYSGTINNSVIIAFSGTDHCYEIDGPEGATTGAFTITNTSVKGDQAEIANFRDGAIGLLRSAYFFNFVAPTFDTNGTEDGGTGKGDFTFSDSNLKTYMNGHLTFTDIEITLANDATNTNVATLKDVFPDFTSTDRDKVTKVVAGEQTQGADISVFDWTFAGAKEQLTEF